MIDTKISFFEQILNTADKAAYRMFAICRPISNVGGHLSSRRRLQMNVIKSTILSTSEIWADFFGKEMYRKRLVQV